MISAGCAQLDPTETPDVFFVGSCSNEPIIAVDTECQFLCTHNRGFKTPRVKCRSDGTFNPNPNNVGCPRKLITMDTCNH